ncbi:MAG: ATP synthase F0 subunit B [Mailhella sp.]|nr:ATP synthase F0 subunit B [Mailhella sp.]
MQRFIKMLGLALLFVVSAAPALANEGEPLPWGNFILRVINFAIFAWIIWHFAGKLIKQHLFGRADTVRQRMDDAELKKKDAELRLADVEQRIANVESECERLLEEGRTQAEKIRASIIADAEKQAAAIIAQAKASAEQEGKTELAAIRARLADEIVAAMEKDLARELDPAGHQDLIDKSLKNVMLKKVVLS